MRRLLRPLLLTLLVLAAALGGAAGGDMLRKRGGDPAATGGEAAIAPEGGGDGAGTGATPQPAAAPAAVPAAPAGSHDAPAPAKAPAEPGPTDITFRFPQQFFVPLVRDGQVRGMLILTLAVTIPEGNEEAVYRNEFRLRDALLRNLLIHANSGGFDGNFTAEAHLELLRARLLETAQAIVPGAISGVLIADIARQEGA